MIGVSAKVTLNKYPTVRARFPTAASHRIRRGAELVKAGAVRRSRYDPFSDGPHMRDGWKVEPAGDGFRVTNPVDHTIFNEYGTVKMSAQPMLHPASDEVAGKMGDLFIGFEGELA